MSIYIFLFMAAPAVYGCCLFYIRLFRALDRKARELASSIHGRFTRAT